MQCQWPKQIDSSKKHTYETEYSRATHSLTQSGPVNSIQFNSLHLSITGRPYPDRYILFGFQYRCRTKRLHALEYPKLATAVAQPVHTRGCSTSGWICSTLFTAKYQAHIHAQTLTYTSPSLSLSLCKPTHVLLQ